MTPLLAVTTLAPLVVLGAEAAPEALPAAEPAVPPAQEEAAADQGWEGSVNVGGTFSDGNSNITTLSVAADAKRRDADNRYSGKLFYNYTTDRDDDATTQDNRGLDLGYDRFLNERLYLLANAGLYTDEIQGLDARTNVGVGAGYQIRETETLDWSGEAGVSLVDEDYATDVDDTDYAAARLSTALGWVINEQVDYSQDLTFFQSLDESEDQITTNDSRFDVSLGESMVASLTYSLVYDNTPATGAERDDHRFILTVGWTF